MSPSPEARFWEWFVANEEKLYRQSNKDVEARENLFDRLLLQLHQVDKHLAFEFSSPQPVREFIFSADGIPESFPAVLRLREAAPSLARWELIAFRPRRDPLSSISMDGLELNSKDFAFTLLTKDKTIGLDLFIPDYREEDLRFRMIAYLFLDQALGEFDVEKKLALIEFLPAEAPQKYERHSFKELPGQFDALYNRLRGLSGKPS